jgi:hypothetical protein
VLPPRLTKELNELQQSYSIEVVEDSDSVNFVFKDFSLGEGYNMPSSDLLLRIPRTYPDAGPDMFWTNEQLVLADGRVPQAAEAFETHLNKRWRRFSWHRAAWNPVVDNLHSHVEFIRKRLRAQK